MFGAQSPRDEIHQVGEDWHNGQQGESAGAYVLKILSPRHDEEADKDEYRAWKRGKNDASNAKCYQGNAQ